jgi:FKBP-type peptidyl-prolyl cis-trans isomerase SlyD
MSRPLPDSPVVMSLVSVFTASMGLVTGNPAKGAVMTEQTNNIQKDKVVTINYKLTDDGGKVLDSSEGREPLTYLHGGGLIPGMEQALEGRSAGEEFQITIPPEKGYGQKDPNMVQPVPRSNFGDTSQIEPGMQFQARTPEGSRIVTVVDVAPDTVTVDANHPLAGVTLHFDVSVVGVRDASTEELQHGHAHGPGGVQH